MAKTLVAKHQISLKNLTSPEGVMLRVKRSFQVESAFGVLKNDYKFIRFLIRGKNSVENELLLICFALNINKLN